MTDEEIRNPPIRVDRNKVNVVNERTPTWAHVLIVCCLAIAAAMLWKWAEMPGSLSFFGGN